MSQVSNFQISSWKRRLKIIPFAMKLSLFGLLEWPNGIPEKEMFPIKLCSRSQLHKEIAKDNILSY